jgi:cell division protein ZapA
MASIEVEIGARKYSVACRDGEEEHLRSVATMVDRKARDAEAALGNMGEARNLLFASLLLADELKEARSGAAAPEKELKSGPDTAEVLERLADRMERLAQSLEQRAPSH